MNMTFSAISPPVSIPLAVQAPIRPKARGFLKSNLIVHRPLLDMAGKSCGSCGGGAR